MDLQYEYLLLRLIQRKGFEQAKKDIILLLVNILRRAGQALFHPWDAFGLQKSFAFFLRKKKCVSAIGAHRLKKCFIFFIHAAKC